MAIGRSGRSARIRGVGFVLLLLSAATNIPAAEPPPAANASPVQSRPAAPRPRGTNILNEANSATTSGPANRSYVREAGIVGHSPLFLKPSASLTVDLKMTLYAYIPRRELIDRMVVYLDGVALLSAPRPWTADLPKSEGVESDSRAASSAGSMPDTVEITLFARLPDKLPEGQTLTLAVFSELDGRNIAYDKVQTAAAVVTPPQPPAGLSGWEVAGIAAVVVTFFLGGLGVWGLQSRWRYNALREQVISERSQANELAQVTRNSGASAWQETQFNPVTPPEALKSALARGELVVVLGPMPSLWAGLPTGTALWLNILVRLRAGIPPDTFIMLRDLLAQSSPEEIVDPLLSMVPREQLLEALAAELQTGGAAAPLLYAQLADLDFHTYVDMTWDGLLERALASRRPLVFAGRQTGLAAALRGQQLCLIRPVGSIAARGEMALTQQEFRRTLAQSPELERCLASLFSTQTLLFVGMNLSALDHFLGSLPPELQSTGREHFALALPERNMQLRAPVFASRFGISMLENAWDADSVSHFLQQLADSAGSGEPAERRSRLPQLSAVGPIRTLQLRNIGNFDSLELDFDPKWSLFLGDNGGGKSTILRAITLALAGNDSRGDAMAARILRRGEQSGSIELGLGSTGQTKVRTALVLDGLRVRIRAPQVTPLQAGQGLILGFPALRGVTTTQPTGPTRMAAPDPSVDDVAPLLEEKVDTRLNQLKQWVINTAMQSENAPQGREARMLATFQAVIREVVPGRHVAFSRVDRTNWTVWLATDDGEVSFDSLSQGTSSILAWVGILLQRLYAVYPNAERPEDCAAIVLIDEIDAHLHPRWQRRLVTLTREKFPNVQIIASSHSPLLAGAMRRTELRIVERDPQTGKMRAAAPLEDVSGQKVDDILTSSLFALPTTRSPAAEALIKAYFALFEKFDRSAAQEQELERLAGELDQLNYGATQQPPRKIEVELNAQLAAVPDAMAESLSARLAGRAPAPAIAATSSQVTKT